MFSATHRNLAIALCIALPMAPWPAAARTWHVRTFGDTDAPSIQAAIDSSSAGDTILVGIGVYRENITIDRSIALISETGPATTVLDGHLFGRVITVLKGLDPGIEISGFTITGGRTSSHGGGISLASKGAVVRDNIIENNGAERWSSGGGIYGTHEVTIAGNTIRNNTASRDGGGISINGSASIHDNSIQDNSAGGAGGGISIHGSSSITNNIVHGNEADGTGGGLYIYGLGECSGNQVTDNIAGVSGGGIDGGSIVTSNLIARNRATLFAGGAMVYGTFRNNTVVDNSSSNGSIAGVRIFGGGLVENNIVANNYSPDQGVGTIGMGCRTPEGAGAIVRCNDIWGHDINDVFQCASIDNFKADPLFCDSTSYEISHTSPCAPTATACGLVGAQQPACSTTAVQKLAWSSLKRLFQ